MENYLEARVTSKTHVNTESLQWPMVTTTWHTDRRFGYIVLMRLSLPLRLTGWRKSGGIDAVPPWIARNALSDA